ncbi:MAG: lamin tail domain-containing protein [Candidatus Berkelbacteria bacterium]
MKRYFSHGFLICAMLFVSTIFTGAYFSDSVAVSGNTFTAGVWVPAKATISEVFYNAVGADTGKEWIEIHNTGGFSLDMTGYVLHFDTLVTTYDYVFPAFSLAPDARVVLHVRTAGSNSATDLYWPDTNSTNMGNTYGSIGLFKSLPKDSTTIVDYVEYGSAGHDGEVKAVGAGIWTAGTFVPYIPTEGHSMQLIGADNNLVTDWQDQTVPTPGA